MQRVRLFLMILFTALVLLIAGIQPLTASPPTSPEMWARWRLHVTFVKDEIKPLWQVQILEDDVVVDERTRHLECTTIGEVTIVEDKAYMDGGHFHCLTGHFAHEVYAMTGGVLLEPTCQAPFIWAKAKSNPNFALSSVNPILFIPDGNIQYTLTEGATLSEANIHLNVGSISTQKNYHYDDAGSHWIGSLLNHCNGITCTYKHWANGSMIDSGEVAASMPLMSTGVVDIYIGRDVEGNAFHGILHEIKKDPPCVGVGQAASCDF